MSYFTPMSVIHEPCGREQAQKTAREVVGGGDKTGQNRGKRDRRTVIVLCIQTVEKREFSEN